MGSGDQVPLPPTIKLLPGTQLSTRNQVPPPPPGRGFTRQPVDEPAELGLGDVGPAEVQGHGLPADHPAQHQGADGPAAPHLHTPPQLLVTAPAPYTSQ